MLGCQEPALPFPLLGGMGFSVCPEVLGRLESRPTFPVSHDGVGDGICEKLSDAHLS